ncbi:MAG TPA: class I SAM-dependent methyltransferase [Ktedonobacteraceae bacterium]|nr:class I SAM-dependent methyltransferase [Ktedonobacteraceae bacterium]
MFDFDTELAKRYGAFASYQSGISPALTEYYGENPAIEMDRLLDLYANTESYVLDVGCGAGHTLCRLASKVKQIWGIDMNADLLQAAQLRIEHLGLTNARVVSANVTEPASLKPLPDATFDLAFSRRGPNLNEHFLRTLSKEAIIVQELVSNFDGYPLREIFGRRHYAPYFHTDQAVLLSNYAELELFPISCKEYFYEEFFRDSEHLEAFLIQNGATLSNWRLPARPYEPLRDRPALDLYIRYNTTSKGIRVLRQRKIFVLRRAVVTYYPVDSASSSSPA